MSPPDDAESIIFCTIGFVVAIGICMYCYNMGRASAPELAPSPVCTVAYVDQYRLYRVNLLEDQLWRLMFNMSAYEAVLATSEKTLDYCEVQLKYLKRQNARFRKEMHSIAVKLMYEKYDGLCLPMDKKYQWCANPHWNATAPINPLRCV
jgi:hypothetical protein